MKKRFMSIALALVLVPGMLPTTMAMPAHHCRGGGKRRSRFSLCNHNKQNDPGGSVGRPKVCG